MATDTLVSEDEKVAQWRFDRFVGQGMPEVHALVLAVNKNVDVSAVDNLIEKGCPWDLFTAILL